jgi:hypothetical protein
MTKPTTEARRHGEKPGDREIGKSKDPEIGRRSDNCYEVKISHAACICHPERVGANATASRRTPAATIPERAASGRSYKTPEDFLQGFRNAIRTFRATLREIFDESAYDRFLLRTQASRSTASYREFTRERDAAMAKKPRCC